MSQPRRHVEAFTLGEGLQAWAETVRDVLVDLLGVGEDDAWRMAREVAVRFAEDHPGQQVYMDKGTRYLLDVRDQEIYAQFNGHNYNELARRFGVAPRHVRRLVRRAQAIDTATRMDDLFPGREIPDRR